MRDASGKFLCGCGRVFESISGLGSHRRHCAHAPVRVPGLEYAAATEAGSSGGAGGEASWMDDVGAPDIVQEDID